MTPADRLHSKVLSTRGSILSFSWCFTEVASIIFGFFSSRSYPCFLFLSRQSKILFTLIDSGRQAIKGIMIVQLSSKNWRHITLVRRVNGVYARALWHYSYVLSTVLRKSRFYTLYIYIYIYIYSARHVWLWLSHKFIFSAYAPLPVFFFFSSLPDITIWMIKQPTICPETGIGSLILSNHDGRLLCKFLPLLS